jgi:hypothetical protein
MLALGDCLEFFELGVPAKEVLVRDRLPDDVLDARGAHNDFVVQQICCATNLL